MTSNLARERVDRTGDTPRIDDAYYKRLILDYLRHYGSAFLDELVMLILDKLSDA
jgi:hypothetical protein